ncbi:MAG TPA: gamma-glutamylcyclotransferase family protein [Solirubrobacteraceae bacterium]|jgi:gamma-glutamylcyclotransferase (GGCT)/AIG2-like uncharacterized protein YtfP
MPLVFGYGSLNEDATRAAELPGWRRTWGVAMDNSLDLPGYKHYVDAATGERPAVFVAFLDIEPADGESVPGAVFEVTEERLAELDVRERNYARARVTTSAGPAVAYVGLAEARERRRRGVAEGRCLVPRAYRDDVRAGFERLTPGGGARFDATTGPLPGPLADLRRIDH